MSSVADAWLAGKVKSTPSTAARNRGIVEGRIKPRWGAQRVGSVEHGEVQKWVADLVAEGLAPTTVRKIVFVLNGIMKTAVKTRRVASNPCIDISLPTAKVKRRRYLTARELEALAKAAGEQGDGRLRAGVLRPAMGRDGRSASTGRRPPERAPGHR